MNKTFSLTVLIVLGLLSMATASPARAEEIAYVTASTLNCRATPEPTGGVVEKLRRGQSVRVVGRKAPWAKVRPASDRPCWVSSTYLAPDAHAYQPHRQAKPAKAARAKSSGPKIKKTRSASSVSWRSARQSRSPSSYAAGGCPCSGSRVCIGPRGGRHCITSGGNKRYGV